MSKIAIRIDDVCENMDWDSFERFEAILDKYNIKPLIGVIPKNMDGTLKSVTNPGYKSWLARRKKQGWTIATHGYLHVYTTKKGGLFPLNDFSEFAGVAFDKQNEAIAEGKQIMEELGVGTDIFMAPGHSFDNNTIRALKGNGYRYITDGFGNCPYTVSGITYLPISFKKSLELKKSNGYTTFVYHTATMKNNDFADFEKFVIANRHSIIDYSELMGQKPKRKTILYLSYVSALARFKHFLTKIKG